MTSSSKATSKGYEPTDAGRTIIFSGKDDDFPEWSFRFKALLGQQGLLEQLQKKTDDRAVQQVYFRIVTSVQGDAVRVVRRVKEGDGVAAWQALVERYASNAGIRKDRLRSRLFARDNVLKPGERVDVFLDRVDDLRKQLSDIGEDYPDHIILGIITRGLPWTDYGPLLANLQLRMSGSEMTFNQTLDHIRLFGENLRELKEEYGPAGPLASSRPRRDEQERALRAGGSDQPSRVTGTSRPRETRTCFNCNQLGHISARCPQRTDRQKPNTNQDRDRESTKCVYCGINGHTATDCRKRKSALKRLEGGGHANLALERVMDVREMALMARAGPELPLQDNTDTSEKTQWIVDSGASSHMSNDNADFATLDPDSKCKVIVATGEAVTSRGRGKVRLPVEGNGDVTLLDVLLVPELENKLFSVAKAVDQGHRVCFGPDKSYIECVDGYTVPIERSGNAFLLPTRESAERARASTERAPTHGPAGTNAMANLALWHRRLAHANLRTTAKAISIPFPVNLDPGTCPSCCVGKSHRQSHPGHVRVASRPGELVFSDLKGPMEVESKGGKRYACLFMDAFTGMRWVYPIRTKDEALDAWIRCKTEEFDSRRIPVDRIHTDGGGEFASRKFADFCHQVGMRQTFTSPYSPEQNGAAERAWRTMFERASCMMIDQNIPKSFWSAAIDTACYIQNLLPSTANPDGKSPYEMWCGKPADLDKLKVWGCRAYLHNETRRALDPRATEGIFIGYERDSKSYLVLCPDGKVRASWNVTFDESSRRRTVAIPGDEGPASTTTESLPEPTLSNEPASRDSEEVPLLEQGGAQQPPPDEQPQLNPGVEHSEPTPQEQQRRPVRATASHAPLRWIEESENVREVHAELEYARQVDAPAPDPRSFKEAMASAEASRWKEACQRELDVLQKTWKLVPRPEGRNIIGAKWVFKVKRAEDGSIKKFKARLCAKGYSQVQGVDYTETFAPVARMTTLRTMLAIAAHKDWAIEQSDVDNAYLNAPMKEVVFMEQPDGFNDGSGRVLLLQYSLYGLMQAGRNWNNELNEWLIKIGFTRSQIDPCLYSKKSDSGSALYLALYVDDLIYAGDDQLITWFKTELGRRFKVTHDGAVHWILGIRVSRDRPKRTLHMTQELYLVDMLRKFNMSDCKPVQTPMETTTHLSKAMSPTSPEERHEMTGKPYKELVGSLLYAANCTRPDLAFAVGVLCRHMEDPGIEHWKAAKRVLRYISGTTRMGLNFGEETSELELTGFTDSDFAGDVDGRRSTSGMIYRLNGAAIAWGSRLQGSVALSSTEAEYIAMSWAAQEGTYLRQLLVDLGQGTATAGPTKLAGDNQGSLFLARNTALSKRSKHIDVRHHYIRQCVEGGLVRLEYIPTADLVADVLTKPLPVPSFVKHRAVLLGELTQA